MRETDWIWLRLLYVVLTILACLAICLDGKDGAVLLILPYSLFFWIEAASYKHEIHETIHENYSVFEWR